MYIVRMGVHTGLKPRDPMFGAMGSGGHRPAQHKREHARIRTAKRRAERIEALRLLAEQNDPRKMVDAAVAAEKVKHKRKVHFATPYGSAICGAFSKAGVVDLSPSAKGVTCARCLAHDDMKGLRP